MNNWFLYHSVCFYGFTLLPSKDSNYIHIFKFFSNYFLPFFLFSFRPLYITWIFLTYTFYLVLFIFSLVFAKSNSFLLPCNKVLKTQWQNIYIYYLVFVGQNSRSSLARCIWFWVSQEAASKVSAAASITSRLNWRNIHSELSHVVVSRTQDLVGCRLMISRYQFLTTWASPWVRVLSPEWGMRKRERER